MVYAIELEVVLYIEELPIVSIIIISNKISLKQ